MKTTQEKTLPRSLTGRRGEGEAAIPVGDGRSIPDIDVFYRAARREFPGIADFRDIAHEAWIISRGRGYFHSLAVREAARNLGFFKEAKSLDEMEEGGFEPAAAEVENPDERLEILRTDPRFSEKIEKILSGKSICAVVGNSGRFLRRARLVAVQPGLF